jgi:hypothetical protein
MYIDNKIKKKNRQPIKRTENKPEMKTRNKFVFFFVSWMSEHEAIVLMLKNTNNILFLNEGKGRAGPCSRLRRDME